MLGIRSASALAVANLLTLYGVFALGWSVAEVTALAWFESVLLGIVALVRLDRARHGSKWFFGALFVLHYGFALLILFLMVTFFFVRPDLLADGRSAGEFIRGVLPAALLLAAGHAAAEAFARRPAAASPDEVVGILTAPYPRIVPLHVATMVGSFLVGLAGGTRVALIILVVVKIAVDVALHLAERNGALPFAPSAAPETL